MNKKRNFWPIGILVIIVIGVLLLVWLVMLSIKDPVFDDEAYFQSYENVEKNINNILKDTEAFNKEYTIYVAANTKPTEDKSNIPLSHYVIKGHRDKEKSLPKTDLYTDKSNQIYIHVFSHQTQSNDLKIHLYLKRYYKENERIDLGQIECKINSDCMSKPFDIKVDGRWKLILKIDYKDHEKDKKIFLEKDFFANK